MIGSFKEMEKKRQVFERKRPQVKFKHPFFRSMSFALMGAALSGVLMGLSFPSFGNATLIYAALVPLFFAVHAASFKRVAVVSLVGGFVFFLVSLGWLTQLTNTVDGAGLKTSAIFGYVALSFFCGLYFIPFGLAVRLGTKLWVGDSLMKNLRFMFVVSMVWVGAEYLRGILFTGFPWNALGISQYENVSIIQIAEWGGVSIISAYIVWMNAGVFVTFRQYTHGDRSRKYRPHFELMLGVTPVALSVAFGMNVLFNVPELYKSVDVVMVQPNVKQLEKWDEAQEQEIRERLGDLSEQAARFPGVDLIIWPETAVPDFLRTSRLSQDLITRVTGYGIPLLVGTMDVERTGERVSYFNSSLLFGEEGELVAKYNKQHLVPFGEYVPFPGLVRKFTNAAVDFGFGEGSTVLPLGDKPAFSVLICFEDIVADLAAEATRSGAYWLINQTNDGWFDPSGQSEQHLAHAVFRCIENRIPMVRCCNTGVSGVIDAYGKVERPLEPRTKGFAQGKVYPRTVGMRHTFYTRHGDVLGKVGVVVGGFLVVAASPLRRKRRKKEAVAEPES